MTANVSNPAPSNSYRWMQLVIGVICMAMIANLQYGWTFFVSPMAKANSWDVAGIQVAFSIFVRWKPGSRRLKDGSSTRSVRSAVRN